MGIAGIANDRGPTPRRQKIMAKYRLSPKQTSILNLDWFEASTELARLVLVNDIHRVIGKRQHRAKPAMALKATRAVGA